MSGTRRTTLGIEADRIVRERTVAIGREVRLARRRRGWSQSELARRAGLGRQVVGRIELGVTRIDADALVRIGLALGRRVELGFARDRLDDPIDAGHLAIQELVLRVARAAGMTTSFELPDRPSEPNRSIDVALTMPREHVVIVVECWNTIGDIGAAARSTARKVADAGAMAAGRWGADAFAVGVWVVRATARNRVLVARYPEVFERRFPASSRAWVASLVKGRRPPAEPGLLWCDVGATRLVEWRRAERGAMGRNETPRRA